MIKKILNQSGILEFGIAPMTPEHFLIPCRAKSKIPKQAHAIIVCLFPYYSEQLHGNISCYAMVDDYHIVVRKLLEDACVRLREQYQSEFVPFVDNSPIPEVFTAIQAGLGVQGQNSMLIHKQYGSYVFIGEIVTDLPIESTAATATSCCDCGKCKQSCPGNAIGNGKIQTERCISHINQKKGVLTQEQIELIKKGGLIWGCDICQQVCPHNAHVKSTHLNCFQTNIIPSIAYDQIDELVKTRAFGFRGATVIKRNYGIIYPKTGNTIFE